MTHNNHTTSPAGQFLSANLRAGAAIYQPGETFGPRTLSDYEIVWITAGQAIYHYGHEQILENVPENMPEKMPLSCGSVLLARPGFLERYVWDEKQTSRHAFLHFDIESKPDDWPVERDWPIACDETNSGLLVALLRELVQWVNARVTANITAVSAREQRLLATIIDTLITPNTPHETSRVDLLPEPVRRSLDAIAANAAQDHCEPLTLDELTRIAKVSPTHLIRLFKQHTNQTPVAAMQLTRLDRASTLIERSNLSMMQIADRLGFVNPYHFSRRFTKAFGLSPSRMRLRLRSGGARPVPLMPLTQKLILPRHERNPPL